MENANGLSPAEAERLGILVEELGESIQAIGKIQRHGFESYHPGDPEQKTNRQDLEIELGDIHAVLKMMYAAKDISQLKVHKHCRKKLAKENRYLHHQPDNVATPLAIIVVAGSRSWNNYNEFTERLEKALRLFGVSNFVIVSGNAKRGADAMAIQWAKENGVQYTTFDADWYTLGKRAGFVRNGQMAEAATHLIAFWDMISNGTKNMVELALDKEIPTLIFKVQSDTPNEE